jgi:hypothetical protein
MRCLCKLRVRVCCCVRQRGQRRERLPIHGFESEQIVGSLDNSSATKRMPSSATARSTPHSLYTSVLETECGADRPASEACQDGRDGAKDSTAGLKMHAGRKVTRVRWRVLLHGCCAAPPPARQRVRCAERVRESARRHSSEWEQLRFAAAAWPDSADEAC